MSAADDRLSPEIIRVAIVVVIGTRAQRSRSAAAPATIVG